MTRSEAQDQLPNRFRHSMSMHMDHIHLHLLFRRKMRATFGQGWINYDGPDSTRVNDLAVWDSLWHTKSDSMMVYADDPETLMFVALLT